MEPLDEKELDSLLGEWKAPKAPASLSKKVLVRRPTWARWLTRGTIHIPVPVALLALVAILAVWLVVGRTPQLPVAQPVNNTTTLADFQPVQQLELRIIEANHENNDAREK